MPTCSRATPAARSSTPTARSSAWTRRRRARAATATRASPRRPRATPSRSPPPSRWRRQIEAGDSSGTVHVGGTAFLGVDLTTDQWSGGAADRGRRLRRAGRHGRAAGGRRDHGDRRPGREHARARSPRCCSTSSPATPSPSPPRAARSRSRSAAAPRSAADPRACSGQAWSGPQACLGRASFATMPRRAALLRLFAMSARSRGADRAFTNTSEVEVKVRPSVKPMCERCRVIKRHGRTMVICTNPRHKQRQG